MLSSIDMLLAFLNLRVQQSVFILQMLTIVELGSQFNPFAYTK